MRKVYVDYNATTYVKDEVLKEMLPYFKDKFGNPSSIYEAGMIAKNDINNARKRIAKIINAKEDEIYFTGSGTEADNTALKGIMRANLSKGNHLITTKIEHHAILNTCKCLEDEGFEVTYLNVDATGKIDLEELKKSIKDTTVLVSVIMANNEIGTIQDIQSIGKICKDNNVIFHSDAVQAVGLIPIDVEKDNLDSISVSAHKFYGPKGVGMLYMKNNVLFKSLIDGGHQELGKRAGTENVPSIMAMAKAMEIATNNIEETNVKNSSIRDYLKKEILRKISNVRINGDLEDKLSNNLNIHIEGVDCNLILLKLNNKGIYASCSSACNSSTKDPSHVLKAIGLSDKECLSSIRFSVGEKVTYSDIDYIVYQLSNIINEIRGNE